MNCQRARAALNALFIGPRLVELERSLLIAAAQPLQHLSVALRIVSIKVLELPFQLKRLGIERNRITLDIDFIRFEVAREMVTRRFGIDLDTTA